MGFMKDKRKTYSLRLTEQDRQALMAAAESEKTSSHSIALQGIRSYLEALGFPVEDSKDEKRCKACDKLLFNHNRSGYCKLHQELSPQRKSRKTAKHRK